MSEEEIEKIRELARKSLVLLRDLKAEDDSLKKQSKRLPFKKLLDVVHIYWKHHTFFTSLSVDERFSFLSEPGSKDWGTIMQWAALKAGTLEGPNKPMKLYSKSEALSLLKSITVAKANGSLPPKMRTVNGGQFGPLIVNGSIDSIEQTELQDALTETKAFFLLDPVVGKGLYEEVTTFLSNDKAPVVLSETKSHPVNSLATNAWFSSDPNDPKKNKMIGLVEISNRVLVGHRENFSDLCEALQNELFELAWRRGRAKSIMANAEFQAISSAISRSLSVWALQRDQPANTKKDPRSAKRFSEDYESALKLYRAAPGFDTKPLNPKGKEAQLVLEMIHFGSAGKLTSLADLRAN